MDNLEVIKPLFRFDEKFFYVLNVMTRGKDLGLPGAEKAQKTRIIKEYYVESLEYLEKKYSEIKKLCEVFNARAYINLNRVNKEKLGFEILEHLTAKLKQADSNYINLLTKAIGNSKTDYRVWVVDLDGSDVEHEQEIKDLIYRVQPLGDKILGEVPTPNGKHLLTTPFNINEFKLNSPISLHIQKNNSTILYSNH